MKGEAVIMGAGPAGLTAALELLTKTDIIPVVLEKSTYMGGISRTLNYKGNRMDIGGHRFFSKSDRVMQWWLDILPPEAGASGLEIAYHRNSRAVPQASCADPRREDRVMLVRNRKSRIYFLGRFFEYPISLSRDTLAKLGVLRVARIGMSYARSALAPIRKVESLEHFFINRFGRELYRTFFKDYTEKVWGIACSQISAEWGEQRIKGLSITKTIAHNIRKRFRKSRDVSQKGTETSLIERFLYPKYGPGQMWEEVARQVRERGGRILTGHEAVKLHAEGERIVAITVRGPDGALRRIEGDYFFSTLPVKELVASLDIDVPGEIRSISDGLVYRDFITVGLLVDRLTVTDGGRSQKLIADNWIYIQEPDVLAGRLQIFNNWSPYMVADSGKVWLGVEYFCYDTDALWSLPDEEMANLAKDELDRIGILNKSEVRDQYVCRMQKTYPAYFGTYPRFDELRKYLDRFENLFLVGRNGMHKYNNQDHSMLTAMTAVENIVSGRRDKSNIWAVNTEMEYHEARAEEPRPEPAETAGTAVGARDYV